MACLRGFGPPTVGSGAAKQRFPRFGERFGRSYDQKKVEVFYAEEGNDIIIITVYVFYGKWE